ncbi:GmrSD restriction endonuclease domain-containing protein [Pseudomonas sp. GNP014]
MQQSDKRLLVLDGQQRLLTLSAFYEGMLNKKEFSLEGVQNSLRVEHIRRLTRIKEGRLMMQLFTTPTVIKKTQESQDLSSIYTLFERLNSGGTRLSPHEIRVALAPGKLMHLVRKLNETKAWRVAFGKPSKISKTMSWCLDSSRYSSHLCHTQAQ